MVDIHPEVPISNRRIDYNGGVPGRLILQLDPGRYEFAFDGGGGTFVDVVASQYVGITQTQKGIIPKQTGGRIPNFDNNEVRVYVFPYPIPYPCAGSVPPTPPPPPQCPSWFVTPQPGSGLYVIENWVASELDVIGLPSAGVTTRLPAAKGDQPGRLTFSLSPNHYEVDITGGPFSGNIKFDIGAGQSLVTPISFASYNNLGRNGATALAIPQGCAGAVVPVTPTLAPAVCPAWFIVPEPGKGLLVIEDWVALSTFGGRQAELVALVGINGDFKFPPSQDGPTGRLIFSLSPGHYQFDTRYPAGKFGVDIAAGRSYVVPLSGNNFTNWPVYELQPPPGCPQGK
jgi:hypothetical protein